jgi:S-layer homology domain
VCSIQFTDVPQGSTFYSYIQCLVCKGIVSGYPDGTFRPNNPVTRGQAAKMIANAAGYGDSIPPTQQIFNDVLPGSTFWLYIERVALHGAINGYPDGSFHPSANVTRGQLAKIDSNVAGYQDDVPSSRQTFSDVPTGSTFWVYIERVAMHGVVNGYPDGTFHPSSNVTRGQASKIVSNTFFPDCTTLPRR